MTIFLLVVALIVALLFVYALVLRPWLKTKPWTAGFFAKVDSVELALFKKSEAMLVSRLLSFGGLLVTAYDALATFAVSLNWTPVTDRVFASIPPDMRGLVITALLAAIGWVIGWLRKQTTKPLELVAVSDKDVAANPKVAEAIAMADATKAEAVSVVKAS